jgi:predicted lipid-binding transport protein (Tim44 family)
MRKLLIGLCALLIGGVLIVNDVEAKRAGASRSTGVQRNVTNAPPASTPAKPAQQAAPAAQPAPAAAPASGFAKWAPLLGGLALGGLLGSMFSGGLGGLGGLGGILLMALLAIGAVMAFKAFSRRREQGAQAPMQLAGMDRETALPPQAPVAVAGGSQSQPQANAVKVPAGFDTVSFLRGAKLNFVKLQVANDLGNLEEIREITTSEMFDVLSKDVRERAGAAQQTDVVSVDADLLEVVTEGDKHWASVRFSGMVRETPGAAPEEFQEVWNLAKPADGSSGWLLAGIQQMQ